MDQILSQLETISSILRERRLGVHSVVVKQAADEIRKLRQRIKELEAQVVSSPANLQGIPPLGSSFEQSEFVKAAKRGFRTMHDSSAIPAPVSRPPETESTIGADNDLPNHPPDVT